MERASQEGRGWRLPHRPQARRSHEPIPGEPPVRGLIDVLKEDARPGIGDYAMIGDCHTAALVSRAGSIDWYCLPRFDGPSVFGALLDPDAGRFRVAPDDFVDASRRYLPDTNVLETEFRCDGGTLRLTDALTVPRLDDGALHPDHVILRRVECVGGAVEVEVLCDPRFDYGRTVPTGRHMGRAGMLTNGGANALVLRSDIPVAPREGASGWAGRARLEAGDVRFLSLTSEYAAPVFLASLGEAAERRLEGTAAWWRSWVEPCAYEGEYRDPVVRSLLALKLLAHPPSGAIVAAVTTSLPETPGGSRNWDYWYCRLRDELRDGSARCQDRRPRLRPPLHGSRLRLNGLARPASPQPCRNGS